MANKKTKKEESKKSMRGRKVSTWKIVLTVILVLIIVLIGSAYVFLETYVPTVDEHPHFAEINTDKGFSLAYGNRMYKPHISRSLAVFKENMEQHLKSLKINTDEIKRLDGVYNFLLLGHDKVALNTDVIMIANFDTNDGSLAIMQLPRDTYIEHDGYSHKINSIFAYLVGRARANGSQNVYHTALSDYCDLVENAFSIEIDNYALLNLDAFEKIVDIVDGVPIDVPEAMHYDDQYQGLSIHIEAGPQVLDGETAAGFVRFRSGYLQADIGRQNAQKLFMTAFLKRVQEKFSVSTVTKIAEQALKNITTDLALTDTVYYAKQALSVDLENMNMMTLPGNAVYANGVSYYVINRKSTLEIVNNYFNVYNTDIPDEMFDRELLFTDSRSAKIDGIYWDGDSEYVVNNGENVDKDGIYIPRYYGEHKEEKKPDVPEVTQTTTEVSSEVSKPDTYEDTQEITADTSELDSEACDSTVESDSLDTGLEDDVSVTKEADTTVADATKESTAETEEADTTAVEITEDITSELEETEALPSDTAEQEESVSEAVNITDAGTDNYVDTESVTQEAAAEGDDSIEADTFEE